MKLDLLSVAVSGSPVEEGSDELVADDASAIFGERWAQEFSQVVRFPSIPPTYQDLVNEFGPNPASRARAECFIATACYGSPWAPTVDLLRCFRDVRLESTTRGRTFVDWYYGVSPPVAAFLAGHRTARWAVRTAFVAPLALGVRWCRLDRPRHPWIRAPRVELQRAGGQRTVQP